MNKKISQPICKLNNNWKALAVIVFLILCFTGGFSLMTAEESDKKPYERAEPLVSEPVQPHVINQDLRELPKAKEWEPGDPVYEIPKRVYPRIENGKESFEVDKVNQSDESGKAK
jgi:hypothetical protein